MLYNCLSCCIWSFKKIINTYKILNFEKPDKTILISVPLEIRKERMLNRNKKMTASDLWEIEMDFDNAVLKNMEDFIDITLNNLGSVDEIVTEIINLIK